MATTEFKKMALIAIIINIFVMLFSFIIKSRISLYSAPFYLAALGFNIYIFVKTRKYDPMGEESKKEQNEGKTIKFTLTALTLIAIIFTLLTLLIILKNAL